MACEVLVVGAGPVGLLAACELRRRGLDVRVIDRAAAASSTSKALAVHARTLEAFDLLGIVDVAVARGRRLAGATARHGERALAEVSLLGADTPGPGLLVLPQSETEAILGARLEAFGGGVERERTLVGLRQDARGVDCVVEGPDGGREEVRAAWVLGCDGAGSTVRTLIGAGWEGEDLPARFALADVSLSWALPADHGQLFVTDAGPVLAIPLPGQGRWRLVAQVAGPDAAEEAPDLAFFAQVLAERVGVAARLTELGWSSAFAVRQRSATRWRVGRCLLAGDAAHAHSPAGGQGMNIGLADALNLAWKLALTQRGRAAAGLLDSYEAERAPIARRVIRDTGRATRAMTLDWPGVPALRRVAARIVGRVPALRRRLVRTLGELDHAFPDSPIVEDARGSVGLAARVDMRAGPSPGERAPDAEMASGARIFDLLRGTHHTLLAFPAGEDAAGGDLAACVAVAEEVGGEELRAAVIVEAGAGGAAHARYGASAPCVYVVRPDGCVGFRSAPPSADALRAWLARVFA